MTPTMIDSVVLGRLTTRDLPAIVGWFRDPDTSRFLAGRIGRRDRARPSPGRLATRMIRALIDHPDPQHGRVVRSGVEPENHASRRTLEAAGFHLRSPGPDCEEMLPYELWAPGRRAT